MNLLKQKCIILVETFYVSTKIKKSIIAAQ